MSMSRKTPISGISTSTRIARCRTRSSERFARPRCRPVALGGAGCARRSRTLTDRSPATEGIAAIRMIRTHAARFLIVALVSGCALGAPLHRAIAGPAVAAEPSPSSPPAMAEQHGRAYFFRGFAGWVFSRGMDHLAERIERAGYTTIVNEAAMCPSVAEEAIGDYRKEAAPITI